MQRKLRLVAPAALAIAGALVWMNVALLGQGKTATRPGEWPTYGGDLASTRYSPLDQITADNFNKLEVAWRFKTDALGPRPEFNFQAHAADGQRRRLHDRRHAPRRRRARRGHRRDAVDAQRERRQARRSGAAPALRPRPRLLDRRRRGAHHLRHARLPDGRAQREDRRPGRQLRQERHRRSEAGRRPDDGSR